MIYVLQSTRIWQIIENRVWDELSKKLKEV